MKTTEGNKLIAEFMGFEKLPQNHYAVNLPHFPGGVERLLPPFAFEFHSSWDWLMSVLAKIKSLNYNVEINHGQANECVIYGEGLYLENVISVGGPDLELIDSTWKAVIEFIQWYNDNK